MARLFHDLAGHVASASFFTPMYFHKNPAASQGKFSVILFFKLLEINGASYEFAQKWYILQSFE